MKAIVFTKYGSPDDLSFDEVPKPAPKDDELLIRVHASSVNSWDWEYLKGTPFVNRLMFGLVRPKPGKRRLGADIAGTVEAAGAQVTRFRPGDEVFGDLWANWGGFAEYAVANETSVERKPANVTFLQAAAVPQAGVLALQGLRTTGQIRSGQKVLINGAGGGVGTLAVQIAKLTGTEVTGVDAGHKLDAVRLVGADRVIDYAETDFTDSGERYDLILDCQGYRPRSAYRRALQPGGVYAMVGGPMLRILQLLAADLFAPRTRQSKKFRLVAEGPNKGLAVLARLLENGKLVPVIDRTFSISEVPDALRYFGEGRHKGKIAIDMLSSAQT